MSPVEDTVSFYDIRWSFILILIEFTFIYCYITTGVMLITIMYIVFYLNHTNFAVGIWLLEHFTFCFCACKNMFEILVRIIHHDTHMNLMVSDWFLYINEVSHHFLRIHWMRVSESHWSVLESCNSLGFRLSGGNWWPFQHLISYEWFVTVNFRN